MHVADQDSHSHAAAADHGHHSSTPAGGQYPLTDSESEDLELSSWDREEDDDDDDAESPGGLRRKSSDMQTSRRPSLTLSDRIVMDPPGGGHVVVSKEDRQIADAKVARNIAINACFIGLWYLFSLLISIYNKWMFSPEHLNFKFPLFVTCGHMIVQFSLSSLVLFAFPQFRPGNFSGPHHHHHHGSGGSERHKQQAGEMTRWFYLTRIGPCGAATGLDIGLGNMSLRFITLAFYTMCKSSSLAFVLLFAFIFRLEQPTYMLVGIISVMTVGVVMMVASEAKFVLVGFILVITASALSGLRWALTQVLLVRNPATSNPFSTIFFLAPMMFLSILCVAIPVEGFGPLFTRFGELVAEWGFVAATGVVVLPGVIAFLMVSSEFALLQRSSVVTLSIAGIFKEVMTITAAAIVFKDPLTPVNISGLAITIVSIGGYNYWKVQKMRAETLEETVHGRGGAAAATSGTSAGGYMVVGEDEEGDVDDDRAEERRRRKAKRKAKKGKAKAKVPGEDEPLTKVEAAEDEEEGAEEASSSKKTQVEVERAGSGARMRAGSIREEPGARRQGEHEEGLI
ncbi:triose-phosphate transporter family-domain-containing protein [Kalaharituber pfeilii]|nr:triose-phosphate transporter family-domain-containing protein [Kalaharituber pfeilii]